MFIVAYLFGFPWIKTRGQRKFDSTDDRLFDQVANELKAKSLIPGLWTKAFAEVNGDEAKAQALYIRYRVQQLQNEKQVQAEREHDREQRDKVMQKAALKRSTSLFDSEYEAVPKPLTPFQKIGLLFLMIVFGCLAIGSLLWSIGSGEEMKGLVISFILAFFCFSCFMFYDRDK